jgi:integral membrane sensor domain MASE1
MPIKKTYLQRLRDGIIFVCFVTSIGLFSGKGETEFYAAYYVHNRIINQSAMYPWYLVSVAGMLLVVAVLLYFVMYKDDENAIDKTE